MISAVDSSVILDVLTNDPSYATRSESTLRNAQAQGQLVVCDCVISEIYPVFRDEEQFNTFFDDWQFDFLTTPKACAILAGSHFTTYLARGGRRGRVVVDFMIGAHAQLLADRLVARDRGYLRDYFEDLAVVDPTNAPP